MLQVVSIGIMCLLIGFLIGFAFIAINRHMAYGRKHLKQYQFNDEDKINTIKADSSFLRNTRKEHASDSFK